MPWAPGDRWPGTAGGAAPDGWGGYTRVFLQAAIDAGDPFALGPSSTATLNGGNVLVAAGGVTRAVTTLWVDLTCDLLDLEITLGSSSGVGILTQSDAGTLTASLYDPTAKYDPLNPDTPYALRGRTRLTPGVGVRCWAEVIRDPAAASPQVNTYPLFSGTADRWSEPWTTDPGDRTATLVATDPTKILARSDKPAQPSPVGAGETPLARLNRILANAGYPGSVTVFGTTVSTLQATTLAQPAWEMVGRVAADELGFAYFVPQGPGSVAPAPSLVLVARDVWTTKPAPALTIGCGPGMFDIATDVVPASFDAQLTNAVYAARSGGAQQSARVQSSIDRWYEQSLERTDLGLADDAQVGIWANAIVSLYAYPHTTVDQMTLRPDLDPKPWASWQAVLGKGLVTGLIRVLWESAGYTADVQSRVVGWTHHLTMATWDVEWRTVAGAASTAAATFHIGPHPQDLLDAGLVLA